MSSRIKFSVHGLFLDEFRKKEKKISTMRNYQKKMFQKIIIIETEPAPSRSEEHTKK